MSTTTVDRVLNKRAHVSPQTHRRVHDAIEELIRQEGQLAAKGRRIFIDIVMEAPLRFIREIRQAAESILADLNPAAIRPRFSVAETMTAETCVSLLTRIGKRGSQGICLKARDTPEVRKAVQDLGRRNIPVITIFTDLPGSGRLAYAGLDNRAAGKTAAYLMQKLLHGKNKAVMTTLSQHAFQGEEERYLGFCSELQRLRPDLEVIDASGGGGLNPDTGRTVADRIFSRREIAGVYSMGGGNMAILDALGQTLQTPSIFIAHDLDEDNVQLLRDERLTLVLHHDLRSDMRTAFRHILGFHGIGEPPSGARSDIQIVTPINVPGGV